MTRLRHLTVTTLAVTYALVAVGGLVRATESGLGCGDDWPVCNGRVVPEGDHHTWIEFTHRAVAAVVVILAVGLALLAWRHARHRRDVFVPAVATVPLVIAQAALGAVVVVLELHAVSVVAHLALAMTLFAVVLALWVNLDRPSGAGPDRGTRRALWTVAGAALAVMLLGSYVSGRAAGLAFTDWPLFDGGLVPSGRGELGWLHGAHRAAAGLVGLALGGVWLWLRRRPGAPEIPRLVLVAGGLYGAQVAVGAANVWTELSAATRTLHLALGAAIWGILATAALVAGRARSPVTQPLRSGQPAQEPAQEPAGQPAQEPAGQPAAPPGVPVGLGARARAYFLLTKPRVIELLLVTTVPAMVLAEGGVPSLPLIGAVLLGGALAAGGANTINCYIDRERDATMHRTRGRPLPSGLVDPWAALWFGVTLEFLAFGWLWATANLLAASLAVAATVFYVFVYSIWLKPRTAQNIVIGGAAGAVPVLVGWAAVTSDLASPAWVLFAIIFVWTPPHFWALSMRYRDDYAAAGVPMLPVVAGVDATTRQIFLYSIAVVAVTFLLWPVAELGAVYAAAAVTLGLMFVWRALQLRRDASPRAAMRMFSYSNVYLALLFGAVALDVVVLRGV